jgi:hypothetical protein
MVEMRDMVLLITQQVVVVLTISQVVKFDGTGRIFVYLLLTWIETHSFQLKEKSYSDTIFMNRVQ